MKRPAMVSKLLNRPGYRRRDWSSPLASALLLSFLTSTATAQTGSVTLLGAISDQLGDPIAQAAIQLAPERTLSFPREQTTDRRGRFIFVGLPAGDYLLEIGVERSKRWRDKLGPLPANSTLELRVILDATGPNAKVTLFRLIRCDPWWGTQFGELSVRRLPHARNLWSLLENQDSSSVTNRLDIGGLAIGDPALFGALGSSWTENQYRLNEFDATDPYQTGWPLADPSLDAVSEMAVLWGAKPALFTGSGAVVEITTVSASRDFHGGGQWFYSHRRLHGNNVDAPLRQLNFPGPAKLRWLADGGVKLGGGLPISSKTVPVFASVSAQQVAQNLGGFPVPLEAKVRRALLSFTPLVGGSQRLDLLYSGEFVLNSHEDPDPRIAPSATTRGHRTFHHFQSRWSRTFGTATVASAGLGAVNALVSSGLQPGEHGSSTIDLPQMLRVGSAPWGTTGRRTRYQAHAVIRNHHEAAGSHSFTAGFDWNRSFVVNRWGTATGMGQVLVNGAASEVIRWNTPTLTRQQVQTTAADLHDAWRPAHWLSLPLGLRLTVASGSARGTAQGIHWATLEPRAGVTLRLWRRDLVLRASWSRFAHLLQGRYLDLGNADALGGEVFQWQDTNADQQAQPDELGFRRRVFGGPHSAIDPRLASPYTDELSLGAEHESARRLQTAVRFFRRDTHHLVAAVNVGVPFSEYAPVSYLDPGNDGIAGTDDDQFLTLYNRNPSALGQDFFLLTNPPGHRASYKGFEIRLTKPLRSRWYWAASFTAMRTAALTNPGNSVYDNDTGVIGSLFADPNTLILAASRTYFDRAFIGKTSGYYLAPFGFYLGAVGKYYDGLPFGRLLFVDGFNQGPFFVRATPRAHPGGFMTEFNLALDVRIARDFRLRRGRLSGYFDIFNVLNLNKKTREGDLTGPTFESRVPLAIQAPRLARVGIEWGF